MEHMGLVIRMLHFKTVASRFDILVGSDFITSNIDISLDFSLLKSEG